MKRWLILTLAAGALGACSPAADETGETRGAPAQAAAVTTEAVYVDVRTPEEFAAGHVEGAINIPHTEMEQRYGELEEHRDDEIVVYCRSGRRSGIAKDILDGVGFENVVNGGGLRDLQEAGVPTTH